MTVPAIRLVDLSAGSERGEGDLPVLLLGPALGTSAAALWGGVSRALGPGMRVIGWELPGHGGAPAAAEDFSVEELSRGVLDALDARTEQQNGSSFVCAGCSVGGAVGLQLLLDAPERVQGAVVVASAPRLGDPQAWRERAELVAAAGTPTQVIDSAQRWFAPGFIDRDAASGDGIATGLLHALQGADRHGYAQVCRALAGFDVSDRLGEIDAPVIAIAGEHDPSVPPQAVRDWAQEIAGARFVQAADAAHLVPAEKPAAVAEQILRLTGAEQAADGGAACAGPADPPRGPQAASQGRDDRTAAQAHADGMRVRREVLSDAHVDRSEARKDDFTAEWQDFISRYAWGEIWTRPGLDRPMRSAITLTALIAAGHWGEFEMHVGAALRNGLTREQIKEILLQSAIYLSVPSANNAFSHAKAVFDRLDEQDAESAHGTPTDDNDHENDEGVSS